MIESNCNQTNSSLSNSACIHLSSEQNTQKASGRLSPSIARVLFSYCYPSISPTFIRKLLGQKNSPKFEVEVNSLLGELVRSAFNLNSHEKVIDFICCCTMLIKRWDNLATENLHLPSSSSAAEVGGFSTSPREMRYFVLSKIGYIFLSKSICIANPCLSGATCKYAAFKKESESLPSPETWNSPHASPRVMNRSPFYLPCFQPPACASPGWYL